MSDATKAIFLSYAREDTDAARRIADALRSQGIEVWFDQNELRGGDTWDGKIKKQIRDCTLFLPFVSQQTQERAEGYFRREWKLAVDRTHDMAAGVAFIVPVVIDETREADAAVPEEFMRYQWTRLPGALPTPEFIAQVKRVLAQPRKPVGSGAAHHTPSAIPPIATAAAADGQKSIAVLAFANLSSDKDNEYFSDGISEELLNVLAKVPELKVAARTSSFFFKGQNVPIPEIAHRLGVAYVVEGSVRKAGERVRITAQLIKAADGFHVWSETYDRELKDIFAVQDEISKNILAAVKVSLIGETVLPQSQTTKLETYTLYLQGKAALARRGAVGLRSAAQKFQESLAFDPDYVPSLVGLARSRMLLPNYAGLTGDPARDELRAAKQAAMRALALEPDNASAHSALGVVLLYEWHWLEAENELKRAAELAPADAEVANFLGDYYRYVGAVSRAVEVERRALDLDPLSAANIWDVGQAYLGTGDYATAIAFAESAISMAPGVLFGYQILVWAAGAAGRMDLVERAIASARTNSPENESMLILMEAYAATLGGRREEALRLLAASEPMVDTGRASPALIGCQYLLLGEPERALGWLQRAYDIRDHFIYRTEFVSFDAISANPITRPFLGKPGIKELYALRQQNAHPSAKKL